MIRHAEALAREEARVRARRAGSGSRAGSPPRARGRARGWRRSRPRACSRCRAWRASRIRGATNSVKKRPSKRRSRTSPPRPWPPLMRTARAPRSAISAGGQAPVGVAADADSRERLGLREVGRHEVAEREQIALAGWRAARALQQSRAGLGDHDGVEDDVAARGGAAGPRRRPGCAARRRASRS